MDRRPSRCESCAMVKIAILCHPCTPAPTGDLEDWLEGQLDQLRKAAPRGHHPSVPAGPGPPRHRDRGRVACRAGTARGIRSAGTRSPGRRLGRSRHGYAVPRAAAEGPDPERVLRAWDGWKAPSTQRPPESIIWVMATIGPAGVLIFTRRAERTQTPRRAAMGRRPTRETKAAMREFRRLHRTRGKNASFRDANRGPKQSTGLIAAEEGKG